MNRSTRRLFVALVLLMLAPRALLPAGVMPMAVDGSLRLVLCGGSLMTTGTDDGQAAPVDPATDDTAHHTHAGHETHAAHQGHADQAGDADRGDGTPESSWHQGKCLFALALFSAPPAAMLELRLDPPARLAFTDFTGAVLPPATGPPRLTAVRGPPSSA